MFQQPSSTGKCIRIPCFNLTNAQNSEHIQFTIINDKYKAPDTRTLAKKRIAGYHITPLMDSLPGYCDFGRPADKSKYGLGSL